MNALIESNYIEEMEYGEDFAYILYEKCVFSSTEYKVLQNQTNSSFVKCMKMLYNGKVQIYYMTSGYKKLSSILSSLDEDKFMAICTNLIANILDVKNNGFLSCQNIDISFDRIYIDCFTYKVRLIYLPVGKRLFDDEASFENELRAGLIKMIQSNSLLSSQKTKQFVANLSNGFMSLNKLYASIKECKMQSSSNKIIPKPHVTQLKLISMNAPTRVEIVVTKNDFVIGQKAEIVDGVVSFNKMISRSHCKITNNGSQYMITDLQSLNGTYVNKTRLQANKPYPIKNGDIVCLANSDFQVIIK